MNKNLLLLIFVLSLYSAVAQNGITFKTNEQFYLKGSSELIGNTILGISSTKPYNKLDVYNDALNLRYTDVDKDKSTFSSSQATLQIPKDKKIKYAALYWSAIYKYDVGIKKAKGKYIVYTEKEKSLPDVNKIFFKTPDTGYQPIDGTILFDSKTTALFEDTQPYLCFADVTQQLQNAKTINGVYTVGNIKATKGYVSGGSAGGWLLYVIYENEEDTKKYFTTYNGFVGVDKSSLIIDFKAFKANETGTVNTSIALATLEGDYKFKTDQCAIKEAESDKYIPLFTAQRKENNFFNSTINASNQEQRNPSSINTLGLDLLKMPIPNKNNRILNNNSTSTSIKLSTKKDGFYLFFVAFETEISEKFVPTIKEKVEEVIVNTSLSPKETIQITETTNLTQKDTIAIKDVVKNIDTTSQSQTKIVVKDIVIEQEEVLTVNIPATKNSTSKPSYLLVTNVFSVLDNAIKWKAELLLRGYDANMYYNPDNNYYYIYILKDYSIETIALEKEKLLGNGAFKDLNIKAFFL